MTISDQDIQSAIDQAIAQAQRDGSEANGIAVSIDISGLKTEFSALPLTLSQAACSQLVQAGVQYLSIRTPQITLALDLATLQTIHANAAGSVTIQAVQAARDQLPAQLQGRPAYALTITSGGATITRFDGYVTISLPYTLQNGEQGSQLQMVWVDGEGQPQPLPDSRYDAKQKAMVGDTNHFTIFGIAPKSVTAPTFTDVTGHWAEEDIRFNASRGLLTGTGEQLFSPDLAMIRGMLVSVLHRLAGAPQVAGVTAFTDVPGDAYYAQAIRWAIAHDVAGGTSATTFEPERALTRQELAVLMTRFTQSTGLTLPDEHPAPVCTDSDAIADWAASAVTAMQRSRILYGRDDGRFDPQGTATRAEVAAVLRRFVEQVMDPAAQD